MKLKQLLDDDRAVSPVIGVILMVAITVILAAVIGSFVLGLGNSVQQTAPNANFQFDFETGTTDVTATHTGGDTISSDATVTLEGTTTGTIATVTSGMSAGDTLSGGYSAGETIRVIWTSENDDTSQTLAEETAP